MIPPSYIILKANESRYVLLSLSLQESKYVEANVVDNPKYLFKNAEWRSDGIEGQPKNYIFKRTSSRSTVLKNYTSTLCKTNSYIIVSWHEPIYIYTMTYAGIVLPSKYFRVFQDDDKYERWHFKKSLEPLPSEPSEPLPSEPIAPPPNIVPVPHIMRIEPIPVKIPSHIVRGFVESAIQKKEVCPITLDPFVMGNVVMTQCGHLFEKGALMNIFNSNSLCPNCRYPIKKEELVVI